MKYKQNEKPFKNFDLQKYTVSLKEVENASDFCVVGVKHFEKLLDELAESQYKIKFYNISSFFVKAILVLSDLKVWLILEPESKNVDIKSMEFSQSLDSIIFNNVVSAMRDKNLDEMIGVDIHFFLSFLWVYSHTLANICGVHVDEIHAMKFINSKELVFRNFNRLKLGKKLAIDNHINIFSEIYYYVARVIDDQFEGEEVTLHDVASNTGLMPYVFSQIHNFGKFNINFASITASDIDEGAIHYHLENAILVDDKSKLSITIEHCDLTKDMASLKTYDIVTAIDVLEHFKDETSKSIFEKIWSHTKKLLIIHVPFEENPSAQYGHLTTFNPSKLDLWASELEDCLNISASYNDVSKCRQLDEMGFLILKRQSG